MAVNFQEDGEAVVRVQTLNIRAERVRAGTEDGQAVEWYGSTNRENRPTERSELSKTKSRCFYSLMIVPFVVMVALMGLGLAIFYVKDQQVRKLCNTSCTLVCNNKSLFSTSEDCHISYISGGVAALSALIITFILLVRVCIGSKVLHCCIITELVFLIFGLAGAILLSLLLEVRKGIKDCIKTCVKLNFEDWNDFMNLAKYIVWVGAGILAVMTMVWLILSISTCCVAHGLREKKRTQMLRQPVERRRRRWNDDEGAGRRRIPDDRQPLFS